MNFDSDSDDAILKANPLRSRAKKVKVTRASIAQTLQENEKEEEEHAKFRAWQKKNEHISDETLDKRVASILSTSHKNGGKLSVEEQQKIDQQEGYDGAFTREEFIAMKEIIDEESTTRQGTMSAIGFSFNDDYFFESKEKAYMALKSGFRALKPCELVNRVSAVLDKDLMKHFLKSDRFLKLLNPGDDDTVNMVKGWLVKLACSADCSDDLSGLGNAACMTIQKIGGYSITAETFLSLLKCWLGNPCESPSSNSEKKTNISGLLNAILLSAQFCSFAEASVNDLGEIVSLILFLGLDATTTIGFRRAINTILDITLAAIAEKDTNNFDAWCQSWSEAFIRKILDCGAEDHWLALPAAVRLVDFSWPGATMRFRTNLSIAVLLECTEVVGKEKMTLEKWLETEHAAYLAAAAGSSLYWKSLCAAHYALNQTLECFDDIVEHQTRLRSTVEAALIALCCGTVVFDDRKATKEGLVFQQKFIIDFDGKTEKLEGRKTGQISSRHVTSADYVLCVIHSLNSALIGYLEERVRVIGHMKQPNISTFFKPKTPEALSS